MQNASVTFSLLLIQHINLICQIATKATNANLNYLTILLWISNKEFAN